MTRAIIMAGGNGERMRSSGRVTPKPLIAVRGVSLLERNLHRLLSSGFRDVVIATPAALPAVADYVRTRGQALAGFFGARLELFIETSPLGNIGAAAETAVDESGLLVVYADNLTGLDLRAIVAHHRKSGATLTSAVHFEPFAIPFGEVRLAGAAIVAYTEKPVHRVPVSSGVFVLAPAAIALLPRNQRTEVSWLANRLLAAGERIGAFVHDAPWIDVNDATAVERAEDLVAAQPAAFEFAATPPDRFVASALIRQSGAVLLERRTPDAARYPGTWDLPGRVIERESLAESAVASELRDCLRLEVATIGAPLSFDDIDVDTRQAIRHLVFPVELRTKHLDPAHGRPLRYVSLDRLDRARVSAAVLRAAAAHRPPSARGSSDVRGEPNGVSGRRLDHSNAYARS